MRCSKAARCRFWPASSGPWISPPGARRHLSRLWHWRGNAATISGRPAHLTRIALVEADVATALRLFGQTLDAFKAAGYVLGQALATGNLGASYADLGLYRRARRLTLEAAAIARRSGAMGPLLVATWNLTEWAFQTGSLDDARTVGAEAVRLTRALRDKRFSAHPSIAAGWLAMREGRAPAAARHFERGAKQGRSLETTTQLQGMTEAARAHLAAGHPMAALVLTRRAAAMHRASDFAPLDSINPAAVWWRHSQALHANGKGKLADTALEQAWRLLLARISSLSDEGLRRNYLNKREENREIVLAWLSHARARKSAEEAARGASGRQGQPRRVVRAIGRHGPAPERDQERRGTARVPGR